MLALSIAGALGSGVSQIIQGSQARRAAKANYQRQQEGLREQYNADSDQIRQFQDQSTDFLSSQNVAGASSGLGRGSSTLELIKGLSETNQQRDLENMRDQSELNYSRGMEQAAADMRTQGQQATGAILGGIGGLASSAGNIYAQGVNSGRWTPGKDSTGRWRMNVPAPKTSRASLGLKRPLKYS